MDRRALFSEANEASTEARSAVGMDEIAPIDIYRMAELMGIKVRFLDVSMEGFYQKAKPPRILLSALRPVGRKAFTCAHEIGHYWFGHGSTVDELQKDDRARSAQPNEVLADGFAGFTLMPVLGIRRAFASRGWKPETAIPSQMLTIATEFGVGYGTLLSHLHWSLRQLSADRYAALDRKTPQTIRRALLGDTDLTGLAIVDAKSVNTSIELETGHGVLAPETAEVSGIALVQIGGPRDGSILYRAVRRGVSTIRIGDHVLAARVWPVRYVGLAAHRYLEDPDD